MGEIVKENSDQRHDIDIIIPFHIENELLQLAIKSALESTGVSTRLILVNDTGLPISRSHFPMRSHDVLVSTETRGYSSALTRGILEVSSNSVAFLDSDDTIHPEKLSIQFHKLLEENLDLISSTLVKVDRFGNPFSGRPLLGEVPRENPNPFDLLLLGAHAADSSILIKSDLLKASWSVHSKFPSVYADYGWFWTLPAEVKTGHSPEAIYYYRAHGAQMSRNPEMLESWSKVSPTVTSNLGKTSLNIQKSFQGVINPRILLALAFPSSLVSLTRRERVEFIALIKRLMSGFPTDSENSKRLLRKTLARRALIVSRFMAVSLYTYLPGFILDVWIRGLSSYRPRVGKRI
jgi:glycosyltransferase involved in cell wall biosynthesis